jgi:hypothetical protein
VAGQHFLPACYIGGFSHEKVGRRRDRRVHVRTTKGRIETPVRAEDLCGRKNFYGCKEVDDQWDALENGLPDAIATLSDSTTALDLDSWLRVAAFASDLFLRGPDFIRRYVARNPNAPEPTAEDLHIINHKRLRERYLNIPCVLRAEWFVQDVPAGHRYITSDRAYSVVKWDNGAHGYAIPLTPTALLKIRRTETDHAKIVFDGTQWNVERIWYTYKSPTLGEVVGLNNATWQFAFDQIYGAEPEDVDSVPPSARDLSTESADSFADGANLLLSYAEERLDHAGVFDLLSSVASTTAPVGTEISIREIFDAVHAHPPGTFSAHGDPYAELAAEP